MQTPSVDPNAWSLAARAQCGAIVALTGLALAPLVMLLVHRIFPGRNVVFVRFGFSHVAVVVLWIVVAMWVSMQIGPPAGNELVADLVRSALVFGSAVALVAAYAVKLDPDGVRALGLRPGRHARAVLAGVVAYFLVLPGILGIGSVWAWFLEWTGFGFEPQPLVEKFAELAPDERVLPIVIGVVAMPLFEEVLFRAFLQPLLVQNLREKAGIAVTSIVFAALHGPGAFLPIFALSLLLGAIMLRTQRLSAVWAVHALHNGFQFVVLYALPQWRDIGS